MRVVEAMVAARLSVHRTLDANLNGFGGGDGCDGCDGGDGCDGCDGDNGNSSLYTLLSVPSLSVISYDVVKTTSLSLVSAHTDSLSSLSPTFLGWGPTFLGFIKSLTVLHAPLNPALTKPALTRRTSSKPDRKQKPPLPPKERPWSGRGGEKPSAQESNSRTKPAEARIVLEKLYFFVEQTVHLLIIP